MDSPASATGVRVETDPDAQHTHQNHHAEHVDKTWKGQEDPARQDPLGTLVRRRRWPPWSRPRRR